MPNPTSYSIAEIAESLAVSARTVELWVATKELRAINVSRDRKSRKVRLRVLQADLVLFLAARATDTQAERQPQRRRRVDVEQFV